MNLPVVKTIHSHQHEPITLAGFGVGAIFRIPSLSFMLRDSDPLTSEKCIHIVATMTNEIGTIAFKTAQSARHERNGRRPRRE